MPSRGYLRNYVQFQNEFRFRQIEPQDKLIDVDRVAWAFPTAVNTKQIGEGPSPTVYPNALLGGDTTPRTDRRWANQQSTIADKGLRAQQFSMVFK